MNPKMFEDAERRYSKEEIAKCIYMAIKHGSVRHCSSEELIYETVEDIMRDVMLKQKTFLFEKLSMLKFWKNRL
jgi:hypothetical protein